MTRHDLYKAMGWLIWRMDGENRKKYSLEAMDRKARTKLEEFQEDPFLSGPIVTQAKSILQSPYKLSDGTLDTACNELCKMILREAKVEDYQSFLIANPRLRKSWELTWNRIRSGRTRII